MVGLRSSFDRRLGAIEAKVSELFAMVAEDLPRAGQALLTGRYGTARGLADHESAIDFGYREIENLACQELVLQAPVACDLRFLLSVLRIVPELERSHDLIMQIAASAGHVPVEDLPPRCRRYTEQMAEMASGMWRLAADAWRQRDRCAAVILDQRHGELDGLNASLTAELASMPMPMPATMELRLVTHLYERLGAHAVNITRRMAFPRPVTREHGVLG